MRRAFTAFAVLICLTFPVVAQEDHRVEVFGGYQYTRFVGDNFNGWNAAVTGNVNSWLGITGDFSGAYRPASEPAGSITNVLIGFHNYSFLFGPTFSYNKGNKAKPFAHALFGVSRVSSTAKANANTGGTLSISDSGNAFAMALGGGVDLSVHKHIGIRLLQADYVLTHFDGATQNNARISTGLVFEF
jgi:opacity protein-like surface antigen